MKSEKDPADRRRSAGSLYNGELTGIREKEYNNNNMSTKARTIQIEQLLEKFPFWEHLTPDEKATVADRAAVRGFEKNQLISSSDTSCMGLVVVLRGGLRISLLSEEGREITLYRLAENDCCVTTASCVIRQITFDTVVSAVDATELLVIPSDVCQHLTNANIYVRAFVFETETERFSQAIWVIQQLLFKRFDQRLAAYLVAAYDETGKSDLRMTQEEIARDVNSAREVVARMLRQFSQDGLVEVKRGHIILLDPEGLRALL